MADLPASLDKEDINKEALRDFIAEQASKDTLIRDAFTRARKRQWIGENILQDPKIAIDLVQTLLLISSTSAEEMEYYLENEEQCAEIYDMVVSDFENGEVSEELKSV